MADKKISALTAATTPLAGTEVLPIVQGGTTVKVTIANVTAGRSPSALTFSADNASGSGVLGWNSLTFTRNGANYINATQSSLNFCATQHIFYNETVGTEFARITSSGNYKPAVAGTGIDFSANANAPGMTSELLTWYEEGTWTPTIAFGGAAVGLTYSTQQGYYTRVGNEVTVWFRIALSAKGSSTGSMTIDGLPFVVGTGGWATNVLDALSMASLTAGGATFIVTTPGQSSLYPLIGTTTGRASLTQAYLTDTSDIRGSITYKV